MAKRALAGLAGVRQVTVSFGEGKARVHYDPSEVTVEQMVGALIRVGFGARALGG